MAEELQPFTSAGKQYLASLTAWLQDVRLVSEAVTRLSSDYEQQGKVAFSSESWPKQKAAQHSLKPFTIKPVELAQRMDGLLKTTWSTQFVFLESLWEEYLQELITELRHKDASVFEPFCEREFMAEVVRDVLVDHVVTIDDIKDEVATRFATGITRDSWHAQWKQLCRLEIGLSDKDSKHQWFSHLDEYFEMRNCIVHRRAKVSSLLRKKSKYYADKDVVDIWPPHLDHYRHQFIACLLHIENCIRGRFGKNTV